MIIKRLVILANSIKNRARCVAGREVWFTAGMHRIGEWVRPVTEVGKGEIAPEQSALPDGSQPCVGELVEVPLIDHVNDPTQPENWRLFIGRIWRRIDNLPQVPLDLLREQPRDLWIEWGEPTDRISAGAVSALGISPSLLLIQPTNFRLVASTEKGTGKRIRRAVFEYGRHRYNLSVTDPTVDNRFFRPFPTQREGPRKVTLPGGDDCLLCVSRTPVFSDGMHYKVVAAVIERGGQPHGN